MRDPLKYLPYLLEKGCLRRKGSLVIWYDVINNSASRHRSNCNTALSSSTLVDALEKFRGKINGIVYNRRQGSSDIYAELQFSGILILHASKHLSSKRNLRKPEYKEELTQLHPLTSIDIGFVSIILHSQKNLWRLAKKSKSKKQKAEKRTEQKAETASRAHRNVFLLTELVICPEGIGSSEVSLTLRVL